MELKGQITTCTQDTLTGKYISTIVTDAPPEGLEANSNLRITFEPWRDQRSRRANSFLWAMIGKMARQLRVRKEEVYKEMLRRYGTYEVFTVTDASALAELIKQPCWRATDIQTVQKGLTTQYEVFCYYGSSDMDSSEFAALVDGVKSEFDEMGLDLPPRQDDFECAKNEKNNTHDQQCGII